MIHHRIMHACMHAANRRRKKRRRKEKKSRETIRIIITNNNTAHQTPIYVKKTQPMWGWKPDPEEEEEKKKNKKKQWKKKLDEFLLFILYFWNVFDMQGIAHTHTPFLFPPSPFLPPQQQTNTK